MRKITKQTLFIIMVALMPVVTSCEKDEENGSFEEHLSPVFKVDLAGNGNLGQEISFIVEHRFMNGCGKFSRSETTENGKDVTVTFYAQYPTNAVCPQDAPIVETVYLYTPKETGEYTFRFNQGDGYITHTLVVER